MHANEQFVLYCCLQQGHKQTAEVSCLFSTLQNPGREGECFLLQQTSRAAEVLKGETSNTDTTNVQAKCLKSWKLGAQPAGRKKAESPVGEQRIREGGVLVVWEEETHKLKTQL